MKLFNKKYVYLEWDDKLEGKDCILAHSYKDLKDFVNSGNKDRIFKIKEGTIHPFSNNWSECDFCYFDPNLAVKKALLEGKEVQYYSSFDKWEDLNLAETCDIEDYLVNVVDWDAYKWRIKPIIVKREHCVTLNKFFEKNVFCVSNFSFDRYVFYKGTKDECEEWVNEHKGMIDIMHAWLNGETIQFYDKDGKTWITVEVPMWDKDFEYRVKPKESTRRMTNRELARWIAEGNGEVGNITNDCASIIFAYDFKRKDEKVAEYIRIRKWDSDEWREPLIEV